MKVYTTIVNDAEALLQDSGNVVFAAAEFDTIFPDGLIAVSRGKPWQYKLTKAVTADSYDMTLTDGDKWRLLEGTGYKQTGIEKIEYLVDQSPREFRGLERFGSTISLEVDSKPVSAVNAYLYMNKIHLLPKEIGTTDTAAALATSAAVGATTLSLKSLGTGTINEGVTCTITGDSTAYYVISTATIDTATATVSIWPPVGTAAAGDTVVTLSLTSSTMDMIQEGFLARWLAATAAISKSTYFYQQIKSAETNITNSATAVAAIAARITQALTDIASGRTASAAGAVAIPLGNAQFDLMSTEVGLAKAALASGLAIINTIPVGGGSQEYMSQATSDVTVSQGYLAAGQAYLQEASADHANATAYLNTASNELRAAGEKASEAVASLRLVSSRLQVSDKGMDYERWGRIELARVERDIRNYGGLPIARRYPRD